MNKSENINMCIIGGVSTGKSTLLNALFCENLSQSKIKRTTMVPVIYIENKTVKMAKKTISNIYEVVSKKNEEIIHKTETKTEKREDYNEMIFDVGKLDMMISKNTDISIYDIPGLNDAKTKNIYYDYLENKFVHFNIIIFVVDIYSGLNTSDEIDILKFIANNIQENKSKKDIYTLVVVNKADDLQLENEELILTGELKEMYEQVERTVKDEFSKKDIKDNLIGIVPLCSLDAYLYKMVKKHKKEFELSKEQILKIGINEVGKKFSTLKPTEQKERVYTILENEETVDTMITLSGFRQFEKVLYDFIIERNMENKMSIDNILFEINELPPLKDIVSFDYNKDIFGVSSMDYYNKYNDYYNKIKEIDETYYIDLKTKLLKEVYDLLIESLLSQTNASEIMQRYKDFNEKILEDIFHNYGDCFIKIEFYPKRLIEHMETLIYNSLTNRRFIPMKEINEFLYIINCFYLNSELILPCIIKFVEYILKRYEENTDVNNLTFCIVMEEDIYTNDFINLIQKILTVISKNETERQNEYVLLIKKLIRYIIMSHYFSKYQKGEYYLIGKMVMFYQYNKEINIYQYLLNLIYPRMIKSLGCMSFYVNDYKLSVNDCDFCTQLDRFYLNTIDFI